MSVLPIVLYNDPVLREKATPVKSDSKEIQTLIDDMFDTMYEASGVGLAAPQIGKSLRLFVVDADIMVEDTDEDPFGPMVFINPEILASDDNKIVIEEGCLSLPELRETVARPDEITIRFLDREFKEHQKTFTGWMSRVIQHEYDHLEGILFFDYLGSFKKRLIARRLQLIDEGQVETEYPIRER
ncbi:MAG: peptide deformylase [Balneolales bacterium]|nr:peptide deformylase [Balneolales bacterium]